jgi:hypothetical protein
MVASLSIKLPPGAGSDQPSPDLTHVDSALSDAESPAALAHEQPGGAKKSIFRDVSRRTKLGTRTPTPKP